MYFYYLFIVAFMLTLLYLKNYIRTVYLAFLMPGPPAVPILGNVLLLNDNKKLQDIGNRCYELFGPVWKCWISIVPFFFINEPQHLQTILGSSKLFTKNIFYSILHNFVGEGLITNNGYKWKLHRRLIQPYLHINVLKIFVNTFAENSNIVVEELKNKSDVNITTFINNFVMNVLQEAVLGIPKSEDFNNSPFRKGQLLATYRLTRPWLLLDSIFKLTAKADVETKQKDNLQNYTKNVLQNKRKNIGNNQNISWSLMDMFEEIAKNNPEFTDEDIINETCTFMLAGQDSVGAATCFTLYFLAKHQEIQEKVLDELNKVFQKRQCKPNFDDVMQMQYLEQCIKEAMRLCPSVPIISRKLTEDVSLGKIVLPEGTNIFISPFAVHKIAHIFPDPLKFDPERFSPENAAKIHSYAYIPFSAGPRNCIGYKFALLEMKVVICEILRHYHLSLTPGHEELNLSYRITLRAKGGIWLRLKERQVIR